MKSAIAVLLFLLMILGSRESFAASYDVQIRQINPDGEIQDVSCSDERECVVSMILQGRTPRKEPVAAHINFKDDGVVTFKFQNFRGYLYAGAKGSNAKSTQMNGRLDQHGRMKTELILYLLGAPIKYKVYQLPVLHGNYQSLAELEITIAPEQ